MTTPSVLSCSIPNLVCLNIKVTDCLAESLMCLPAMEREEYNVNTTDCWKQELCLGFDQHTPVQAELGRSCDTESSGRPNVSPCTLVLATIESHNFERRLTLLKGDSALERSGCSCCLGCVWQHSTAARKQHFSLWRRFTPIPRSCNVETSVARPDGASRSQ